MRQPHSMELQSRSAAMSGFDQSRRRRGPIAQIVRGAAEGLAPLIILAVLLGFLYEASVIGRTMAGRNGIDALQRTELVIGVGGVLLALIIYLVTLIRTTHGVRDRQIAGEHLEAMATMLCLAFSAVVTLIPLFVALTTPQHPAP